MTKERVLASRIRQRLKESEPLIQVIIGPRQVGKTTAVKAALNGRGVYEKVKELYLPYKIICDSSAMLSS